MLFEFSGATISRVIDRSHAVVREHAHDWPVLSLFVMGAYVNGTESGDLTVAGPSAILYRAGAAHWNEVGPAGFEQIEIEFDPAWLGRGTLPDAPVSRWLGGRTGAASRALARLCGEAPTENRLRAAVRQFLALARADTQRPLPPWAPAAAERIAEHAETKVSELARAAERHPSWFGAAFRRATGERVQEAAARHRVERAAQLLRETDLSLAEVAADAGFCDQSHMNRTFARVLARSPAVVRAERRAIRRTACA
jgi:AraC family transcriptional regulator